METEGSSIAVGVRIRPVQAHENSESSWYASSGTLVKDSSGCRQYELDHVFDQDCSNAHVYEHHVKPMISGVVHGVNASVLCYGQTSSGKTHTMRGHSDDPGLVQRSVHDLFHDVQCHTEREFLIRVSMIELFNEQLHDLLEPHRSGSLRPKEDPSSGDVYIENVCEAVVTSPEHALELMASGEQRRATARTGMNACSSRSHAIFRIVVESRQRGGVEYAVRVSHCTLADLAGSERADKAGSEGARLREGAYINKSLMCLGTVINRLSSAASATSASCTHHQQQQQHVPYRDSKLTRILQPGLGGNARCAMICTITPSRSHFEESHNTLRFALRARNVHNDARVNEIVSDTAMLQRQKREIQELRRLLYECNNSNNNGSGKSNGDIDADELQRLRQEKEAAESKLDRLASIVLNGQCSSSATLPHHQKGPTHQTVKRRASVGATEHHAPLIVQMDKSDAMESIGTSTNDLEYEQQYHHKKASCSGSLHQGADSFDQNTPYFPSDQREKFQAGAGRGSTEYHFEPHTEMQQEQQTSETLQRELSLEKKASDVVMNAMRSAQNDLLHQMVQCDRMHADSCTLSDLTTSGADRRMQRCVWLERMEAKETQTDHVMMQTLDASVRCSSDPESASADKNSADLSEAALYKADASVQCVDHIQHEEEARKLREQRETAERVKQLEAKLRERESHLAKLMHKHKERKSELVSVKQELAQERAKMPKARRPRSHDAPLQPLDENARWQNTGTKSG